MTTTSDARARIQQEINQPTECDGCHETYPTLAEVFSHVCPGEYGGRIYAVDPAPVHSNGTGSGQRQAAAQLPEGDEMTPAEVEAWLTGLGRKVEMGDMTEALRKAAQRWAAPYSGTFQFMLDMQLAAISRRGLSVGQAKGVLNCWRAEVSRRPQPQPQQARRTAEDLTLVPEDGFYATADGETVYKVQVAVHGSGKPYAKCLDAETGRFEYTPGAIRTVASGLRNGSIVPLTLEVARTLGHLYGRCVVCGRTLTDEQSIEAGIGPVCSGRLA